MSYLSNIWPEPDYDSLIKQGTCSFEMAYWQKQMRDSLPENPKRQDGTNEYVEFVSALKKDITNAKEPFLLSEWMLKNGYAEVSNTGFGLNTAKVLRNTGIDINRTSKDLFVLDREARLTGFLNSNLTDKDIKNINNYAHSDITDVQTALRDIYYDTNPQLSCYEINSKIINAISNFPNTYLNMYSIDDSTYAKEKERTRQLSEEVKSLTSRCFYMVDGYKHQATDTKSLQTIYEVLDRLAFQNTYGISARNRDNLSIDNAAYQINATINPNSNDPSIKVSLTKINRLLSGLYDPMTDQPISEDYPWDESLPINEYLHAVLKNGYDQMITENHHFFDDLSNIAYKLEVCFSNFGKVMYDSGSNANQNPEWSDFAAIAKIKMNRIKQEVIAQLDLLMEPNTPNVDDRTRFLSIVKLTNDLNESTTYMQRYVNAYLRDQSMNGLGEYPKNNEIAVKLKDWIDENINYSKTQTGDSFKETNGIFMLHVIVALDEAKDSLEKYQSLLLKNQQQYKEQYGQTITPEQASKRFTENIFSNTREPQPVSTSHKKGMAGLK